jgi:hypothetical protein
VITLRVFLGTVRHHSKQLIDSLQVVPPAPPLVTVSLQAGLAKEVELLLKCVVLVVQEQQVMPTPELLTTIQLAGVSETTSHLTAPVPTSRLATRPTTSAALPPSHVGHLEEELAVIQRTTRERVAMAEEQEQKIEEPALQVCSSPI